MTLVYVQPGEQAARVLGALGVRTDSVLSFEIKVAGGEVAQATVVYALDADQLRNAVALAVGE